MAIGPSRAIVVSPSSQNSTSSCSAPSTSFHYGRWIPGCIQFLGTWSDCRGFRFGEIFRYGLAALSTCSWSHLRAMQSHQRSHDVVENVTATCPHHHLVVTTFGEKRIFQLLKFVFPPCYVGHERGFRFDVPLSLEEGHLDLRRFVLVSRDLPASVQFFRDQINAVVLYRRIVHDDLCCTGSSAKMRSPAIVEGRASFFGRHTPELVLRSSEVDPVQTVVSLLCPRQIFPIASP